MVQNKGLVFKKIPQGWPVKGEHLVVEAREFDLDAAPPSGGLMIKTCYASFDPYQRGRMRPEHIKSYAPAYPLGQPVTNHSVGKVLKSDNSNYKPGDLVYGMFSTEEYSFVPKTLVDNPQQFYKLPTHYKLDPKYFVGALGMSGLTAYSSLLEIGEPNKGETIFISSASGSVGQVVGGLAKTLGLKVLGSVGSDDKLEFIVKDLGFDGGFNYKKEKPLDALRRLAPDGIDIYYENVGGEQLEAALEVINNFGRIIACGMISQYNSAPEDRYGVKNLMQVVGKRLKMQGFIVFDPGFGPKYHDDHQKTVGRWISEGSFKPATDETVGIDNAVDGFLGMLAGKNFGKAYLKIADVDEVRSKL